MGPPAPAGGLTATLLWARGWKGWLLRGGVLLPSSATGQTVAPPQPPTLFTPELSAPLFPSGTTPHPPRPVATPAPPHRPLEVGAG